MLEGRVSRFPILKNRELGFSLGLDSGFQAGFGVDKAGEFAIYAVRRLAPTMWRRLRL
jgi:hypothetical protein